jgi:hypothetical protein
LWVDRGIITSGDGGSRILWNGSFLSECTVSHPRRWHFSDIFVCCALCVLCRKKALFILFLFYIMILFIIVLCALYYFMSYYFPLHFLPCLCVGWMTYMNNKCFSSGKR